MKLQGLTAGHAETQMLKNIILGFVILLLAGCASAPLMSSLLGNSDKTATETSQLFFDDFSETGSGWDRFEGEIGSTSYQDETFQIRVNEPNTDLFANPGQLFKDVVIEVTANRLGGPLDNNFGVICRYQDEKNFYAAQISSDCLLYTSDAADELLCVDPGGSRIIKKKKKINKHIQCSNSANPHHSFPNILTCPIDTAGKRLV